MKGLSPKFELAIIYNHILMANCFVMILSTIYHQTDIDKFTKPRHSLKLKVSGWNLDQDLYNRAKEVRCLILYPHSRKELHQIWWAIIWDGLARKTPWVLKMSHLILRALNILVGGKNEGYILFVIWEEKKGEKPLIEQSFFYFYLFFIITCT